MKINTIRHCLILLWALAMAGCTGHLIPNAAPPKDGQGNPFVIITTTSQDTLTSLARKYLKDKDKAWQIAAYNDIKTLKPGDRVVIPLVPAALGGIRTDGFQTVPILLYTRIAKQPTNAHTVSVGNFDRQLQYLDEHDFTTVSLEWLNRFFNFKEQPPSNPVVVSIDSSRQWVFDIAYPMLKKRGMKGALFIRIGEIGRKGNLTWKQLLEMSAGGIDIGVHGLSSDTPDLKDLKSRLKVLEAGLAEPIKAFQKHLNQKCRYYAYPKGRADDLIIAMLKKNGYRSAFTRIRGSNPFFSNEFNIRRSLIYGNYGMDQFIKNLITFHKADLK